MSAIRSRFCQLAISRLGAVVVWGQLDCSELVAECLRGVGGPDLRATHRAKDMARETRPLLPGEDVYPGDLAFFGADADHIIHVEILMAGGGTISADGATSKVTTLKQARANESARVRYHDKPQHRRDYLFSSRNLYLDSIDKVER
jgi:cell wall-associated NlpC family hydrolase